MDQKFQHKKSLGQNFLNSDYVPKQMCDAGRVAPGDVVLEIGPGTGALTRELLKRGATVITIEADKRAISSLQDSFTDEIARHQLTIHHQDARTLFPSELGLLPKQYKVVANIPYYLSGLLLRQLLDTECQPTTLVFLIQKELAERIARDNKESLLSLSVKAFGDPSYICTIKRGHFTPPPKVDSAILLIDDISDKHFKNRSKQQFFSLLHLGFGQKRKQLLGNLSSTYPRTVLTEVFKTLSLPLDCRAEDLPLANWLALLDQVEAIQK